MQKTMFTKNEFINDIYIRRIFSNPINKDYVTKLFLALENDNNIEVLEVVNFKILNNELNNYSDLSNRVTDSYFKIYTTKGPILLNTEFNSQKSKKGYNKRYVYVCHMLLKIFGNETMESYYKSIQININNYDKYRKGQFIYKEDLIRKYDNDEEYIITIYDINVAILRKLSYEDIRKLDRLGAKYLSLIFISNAEIMFEGDTMILRIVKELNELSKTLDDYDPDEFKKEVVTEAVIEENKIATVKEFIKNGASKELILKSTDITENQYNNLLDEVKKETKN